MTWGQDSKATSINLSKKNALKFIIRGKVCPRMQEITFQNNISDVFILNMPMLILSSYVDQIVNYANIHEDM